MTTIPQYEVIRNKSHIPILKRIRDTKANAKDFTKPNDIYKYAVSERLHFDKYAEEHVWIIALSNKKIPMGLFEVTCGDVNTAYLSIASVLTRVLLSGCRSFVILHNHPDNDLKFSKEDTQMAKRLKEASDIVGLEFCDSIIVTEKGYFSLYEYLK